RSFPHGRPRQPSRGASSLASGKAGARGVSPELSRQPERLSIMSQRTASFHIHGISVEVLADPVALGAAAAAKTAALLREAIARRGKARILVGTGNSQLRFIEALVREPGIAWSQVESFHLDEYVGISAEHPASFRLWIRTRFVEQARPGASHYL